MESEVRKAAERLRRYGHGDNRAYESQLEPHEIDLDKVEHDRRVVAAWAVPLLDETPINRDALAALEFDVYDDCVHLAEKRVVRHNCAFCIEVRQRDLEVHACGTPQPHIKTVGQLRMLLTALGIHPPSPTTR